MAVRSLKGKTLAEGIFPRAGQSGIAEPQVEKEDDAGVKRVKKKGEMWYYECRRRGENDRQRDSKRSFAIKSL